VHRREQGSTLPFIALTIVLIGVTVILLGRMGGAAYCRTADRFELASP